MQKHSKTNHNTWRKTMNLIILKRRLTISSFHEIPYEIRNIAQKAKFIKAINYIKTDDTIRTLNRLKTGEVKEASFYVKNFEEVKSYILYLFSNRFISEIKLKIIIEENLLKKEKNIRIKIKEPKISGIYTTPYSLIKITPEEISLKLIKILQEYRIKTSFYTMEFNGRNIYVMSETPINISTVNVEEINQKETILDSFSPEENQIKMFNTTGSYKVIQTLLKNLEKQKFIEKIGITFISTLIELLANYYTLSLYREEYRVKRQAEIKIKKVNMFNYQIEIC